MQLPKLAKRTSPQGSRRALENSYKQKGPTHPRAFCSTERNRPSVFVKWRGQLVREPPHFKVRISSNPTIKVAPASQLIAHVDHLSAPKWTVLHFFRLIICRCAVPSELHQSCSTTLKSELLICRPPLYLMKPNFRNLFMKKFTRERVEPIVSASISCDILGSTPCGWSSLP